MDLMKLDTPNLLLVQSPKDDLDVDQMFIEVIRTFIHKNALREVILDHVPTIMVSALYIFTIAMKITIILFIVLFRS